MTPRLVTVAHGTRDPRGPEVLGRLTDRVARIAGVDVVGAYVELAEPSFASVMDASRGPSVVVPLLLSTGYHVKHDLPESAALSRFPVKTTQPLGPHPLLAAAAAGQLRAAGARPDDAVVMVVAGSKDPDATTQVVLAARMLQREWAGPVRLAFLSGPGPRVPEVMERLRAHGYPRVAASPYLLAPGHFAATAAAVARAHGAVAVADLLAGHPFVAEVVVRRYRAALSRAA